MSAKVAFHVAASNERFRAARGYCSMIGLRTLLQFALLACSAQAGWFSRGSTEKPDTKKAAPQAPAAPDAAEDKAALGRTLADAIRPFNRWVELYGLHGQKEIVKRAVRPKVIATKDADAENARDEVGVAVVCADHAARSMAL